MQLVFCWMPVTTKHVYAQENKIWCGPIKYEYTSMLCQSECAYLFKQKQNQFSIHVFEYTNVMHYLWTYLPQWQSTRVHIQSNLSKEVNGRFILRYLLYMNCGPLYKMVCLLLWCWTNILLCYLCSDCCYLCSDWCYLCSYRCYLCFDCCYFSFDWCYLCSECCYLCSDRCYLCSDCCYLF